MTTPANLDQIDAALRILDRGDITLGGRWQPFSLSNSEAIDRSL